jgi:hypothetical protein
MGVILLLITCIKFSKQQLYFLLLRFPSSVKVDGIMWFPGESETARGSGKCLQGWLFVLPSLLLFANYYVSVAQNWVLYSISYILYRIK